jgi:SPP1 family predicted phage head-tail adaptor
MRAGLLRHRVILQRATMTRDEAGQEIADWQPYATVWAEAEPLRGRELLAAQQAQAEVTTRFRIRYRPDVLPTDRVVWDGAVYAITSPPIDWRGRRMLLELMCASGLREETAA